MITLLSTAAVGIWSYGKEAGEGKPQEPGLDPSSSIRMKDPKRTLAAASISHLLPNTLPRIGRMFKSMPGASYNGEFLM